MSDNQKYYYIKLKDNYFEKDNIKILESSENGYIYSLIILKMCLKASKYDGRLMMTPSIPYDPEKVAILASVINHDIAHVKEAIRLGVELDIISIIDGREIWMNEIQNMIGKSSTEADRIREYRSKIQPKQIVQMYDESTPELEIEREIEREIEGKALTFEQSCKQISEWWNGMRLGPQFRFTTTLGLNSKERESFSIVLTRYKLDEIYKALHTYYDITKDTEHFDVFPKDYRLPGFLASGVEQYLDDAKPLERCRKKTPKGEHITTPDEVTAMLAQFAAEKEANGGRNGNA